MSSGSVFHTNGPETRKHLCPNGVFWFEGQSGHLIERIAGEPCMTRDRGDDTAEVCMSDRDHGGAGGRCARRMQS